MMKKLLLSFALIASAIFASAQAINFEQDGVVIENGQEIIVTELSDWGEFNLELQLRNNTNDSLYIVVAKEEIQMVDSTQNYFCWGQCLSPAIAVSAPVGLPGNSVSEHGFLSFHHMYISTFWEPGTSVVKYMAYPENDRDNVIYFYALFAYQATSAEEVTYDNSFGQGYPNPASSVINFDYNLNSSQMATINVFNLLGQQVMQENINGGQGSINISVEDLQEGIYFCNFIIDNEVVKTSKFVVKK